MASCGSVVGLIFLVITTLAMVISFATPFWVETFLSHRGLWAICMRTDGCNWSFEEDFSFSNNRDDWWKAVQGLMTIGLALGLLTLILASIALCCQCRGCNPNKLVAAILVIAFLSIGVGVIVFGIKSHEEMNVGIDVTDGVYFGWSYWLAVSSAGLCLLTSVVYSLESKHYYD